MICALAAPGEEADTNPLLQVKRIYVEELTGDETADQIRDMIIAGFHGAGLFALTENAESADAVLRGSAEDLIYTETHDSHDSVSARGTINVTPSRSTTSSRSSRLYVNSQIGENEGSRVVERKHEAMAAVRLVNRAGDVIWSTVQESRGAKLNGASADVAQKVTKQLVRDVKKARDSLTAADPPDTTH